MITNRAARRLSTNTWCVRSNIPWTGWDPQLPLIGRADWNDCLNLNCFSDTPGQSFQTTTNKDGKVAESVFIAGLFVLAAKEMIDLANISEKRMRLPDTSRPSGIWKPR